MVRRAAIATEASTTVEHGRIRHEDAGGVVVAGDGDGRHLREGLRVGIPHLGDELGSLICKAHGEVLAAGDENFPIGQDDAVVEGPFVGHVIYRGYVRRGVRVS